MNPWAAVAISLASALGGGLVGSLWSTRMQIHHEREEALRGRMIEAADEFTRKAIEALNSLSRLVDVLQPDDLALDDSNGIDYEDVKAMADRAFAAPAGEARQLVDETRIRLARVHLLFGSESDAGRQASELVGQLSFGVTIFDDEPGIPAVELGKRQLDRSRTAYEQFSAEVRRAIRRPVLPVDVQQPKEITPEADPF